MLKDQIELLSELNAHGVDYLVIGGHAVNAHGVPRTTKDLDVLVRSDRPTSERVFAALAKFGAPLIGMSPADFDNQPDIVFQVGVPPSRVDILQSISGVTFEQAWKNRVRAIVHKSVEALFISRDDLIANKRTTGRARDAADVEELQEVARVQAEDSRISPGSAYIQLEPSEECPR